MLTGRTGACYLQAGAHVSWGSLGGREEEEEQPKEEEEQPVEELGGLRLTWPGLVWNGSDESVLCCDFHCLDLVEISMMLMLREPHPPDRNVPLTR